MLITLTIIGVIAALTIPTLMKNYEKRQIEVGLAKTYQELSNVMKRSEVDNGEFIDWQYKNEWFNTSFINKYIAPYIKLNMCKGYGGDNNSQFVCFKNPSGGSWKNLDKSAGGINGVGFIQPKYKLSDGRSIAINPAYDNGRDWRYVEFVVDVNGDRGDSIIGIDVFKFTYMDYIYTSYAAGKNRYRGLYPGDIGSGGGIFGPYETEESRINNCKNTGNSCAYFLMKNNWKFPDDYPIKF